MSAFLPFWSRVFAQGSSISGWSVGTAQGRLSSCEAGDKATNDHIRDEGQNRCREKQLQGVNAGMHADLVDRVQDERDDEDAPDIVPACRNNSGRRPGLEKTVHKKGGWPSRASCNPARIAKRTATAGWMISRKVIGPSERPMRFSHPRLSASSTIHLPGRAPLNRTTATYWVQLGRPARAERPFCPLYRPEMPALVGAHSAVQRD